MKAFSLLTTVASLCRSASVVTAKQWLAVKQ